MALLLASLLLLMVFSVRPMKLRKELINHAAASSTVSLTPGAQDLIKIEHQKAIEEIKTRVDLEDRWFHIKFLLIGGVIASFLGYLRAGNDKEHAPEHEGKGSAPESRLAEVLHSNATCSVLALACVVAWAIDIHIRNNISVIHQLALWITHYVEPTLLGRPLNLTNPTGFLPWEPFLRLDLQQPGGRLAGMHSDELYGFTFWPHLHFLTWVVYILYLTVFQAVCLRLGPQETGQKGVLLAGFVLVHVAVMAFTWIAHAAPSAFVLDPLPLPFIKGLPENWASPVSYLAFSLLLPLVSLPYLLRLRSVKEDPS